MKVNFYSSKNKNEIGTVIANLFRKWCKDYDITDEHEVREMWYSPSTQEQFVKWLRETNIVNASVFCFRNDKNQIVAMGLDIEEDHLYTVFLLKKDIYDIEE